MARSSGKIQISLTLLRDKRGEQRGSEPQGRIEQQRRLDEVIEDKSKCSLQGEQSRYFLSDRIWFKQHKNVSLGVSN